jgi:hypothetical protein
MIENIIKNSTKINNAAKSLETELLDKGNTTTPESSSDSIGVNSIVKDYIGEFIDPLSILYGVILTFIGYIFNAVIAIFVQK